MTKAELVARIAKDTALKSANRRRSYTRSSAVCKRRCVKVTRSPWWDSARSGCDPAPLAKGGTHARARRCGCQPTGSRLSKPAKACATPSGNRQPYQDIGARWGVMADVGRVAPPPSAPQHPWRVPGWPFVALH
jgi:hypothetical protein